MNKDKMQRLFYNTLNQVINEVDSRASHQNTKLYLAVSALQFENSHFLDVKIVQPLLDLVNRVSVKAEFGVAKTYIAKFNSDEKTKLTTTFRKTYTMPTVHLALKLGVTLRALTIECENSFSVLKTIM